MKRQTSKFFAVVCAVVMLFQSGVVGAENDMDSLQSRVKQAWSETANTRTRTMLDDSGNVIFQRTYDKATGKFLHEGPATDAEAAQVAVEVAPVPDTKADIQPEVKADATSGTAKQVWKEGMATWTGNVEFGARGESTQNDKNHTYRELFNDKDGIGINKLNLNRVSDKRLFRFRAESFGSWNQSFGADALYRHEAMFKVRAKFRRTDWDFGTVLDPSSVRETFTLDASYDRSELKWRPRVTLNFKGEDSTGNTLRAQGGTNWNLPRDRFPQTWNPASRDFNLGLFGGRGKADFGFTYGEETNRESTLRNYQRDIDFNGLSDAIQLWKYQQNFTQSTAGKASYKFNDRYTFSLAITTTSTDNKFDTVRNRYEPTDLLLEQMNTFGLQGQNHGWADGYSRTEEYILEGKPSDKWGVEARIERRTLRTRADGIVEYFNRNNELTGSDDTATYNKMDEGFFEVRADYYGLERTPIYAGYRYMDREEFDNDQLGTYAYDSLQRRTVLASTRAVSRYTTLDQTERMGFLGFKHRFNPKWAIDLRYEGGTMDDNNSAASTRNPQTLYNSYDKTRQVMTVRADPSKEVNLMLKLRRDLTDRHNINAKDDRQSGAIFANWTPLKRKFTVGTGYTRTTGDFSLRYGSFKDIIETVSLNGTYKFDRLWSALLDLNQSTTGDMTRTDYQVGQLLVRRQLKHGHDASIGYSRRYYDNRNVAADKFTNHVFTLSYNLPL